MFNIFDYISIFFGALAQGAIGFGGAIITNAVMSISHPIKEIGSKIVLFQILTGAIIIGYNLLRGQIAAAQTRNPNIIKEIILFTISGLIGVFFGKRLILHIDNHTGRMVIAGIVIISLISKQISGKHLYTSKRLKPFICVILGLLAGAFGFAFNINGAFVALLVLFCALPKDIGTLFSVCYFFGMNFVFMYMHQKLGLMMNPLSQAQVIGYGAIILGVASGLALQKAIPEKYYHSLVNGFLLVSLVLLII